MKTSIYTLSDPTDNVVRYVGKTRMALKFRLKKHYCPSSLRLKTRSAQWMKHLRGRGLKPVMTVIETCEGDTWEDAERWWISYYKTQGVDLVNLTLGGEGGGVPGRPCSPETRAKIAAANKGHAHNPGNKAFTGRKHSAETIEKMRISATGRRWSTDKKCWIRPILL